MITAPPSEETPTGDIVEIVGAGVYLKKAVDTVGENCSEFSDTVTPIASESAYEDTDGGDGEEQVKRVGEM